MSAFESAFLAFIVTLPATVLATRLVLSWLRHRQIFDHPNERSSHSRPTPRGGGLAVAPVVLLAWAALGLGCVGLPGMAPVLLAAFGLLALSWFDDRGGLSPRLRFLCHFVAAALGLAVLPADQLVFQGWLPWWADRAVCWLAWVWFINLYNFMDGIDGITGVETACIGLGLALLAVVGGGLPGEAALPAAVAAAGIGFLVWNWHPARIFLGDSGSIPLGYLLGWLLIVAAAQGHLVAALILPLYYLADATLTLARRARRGEKLWQAHRQHFYQQAVRAGIRHDQVARLILAANIVLMGLALWAEVQPWPALLLAGLVVVAVLVRLGRWAPSR